MGKLLIIGAAVLGFHGAPAHHRQYWWPATSGCTISTVEKNGVLRATPYVQCVARPAGWHSTPAPPAPPVLPYGPCGYEGRLC